MNQTECAEKAVWLEILDALPTEEHNKIVAGWSKDALTGALAKGMLGFWGKYAVSIVLKGMGVKEVIPGKLWMKSKF